MNNFTFKPRTTKEESATSVESTAPKQNPTLDFSKQAADLETMIQELEEAYRIQPRNEVYNILVSLYQVKKDFKII